MSIRKSALDLSIAAATTGARSKSTSSSAAIDAQRDLAEARGQICPGNNNQPT